MGTRVGFWIVKPTNYFPLNEIDAQPRSQKTKTQLISSRTRIEGAELSVADLFAKPQSPVPNPNPN